MSGLYAACVLVRHGIKPTVFEANDMVGGLLRSTNLSNYTFDIGGTHVFYAFTPESLHYTQKLLKFLDGNSIKHVRDARIYYDGKYIEFPFESGIYDLSPKERYSCLKGVFDSYLKSKNANTNDVKNFRDWCYRVFGEYIGSNYLIPYNEKIWKRSLRNISLDWVKGRVPNPPLEDVMKASVGLRVVGSSSNSSFYYPMRGGIESLIEALVSFLKDHDVKILTNCRVTEIRKENSHYLLKTQNSDEFEVKNVISTIPLKEIPHMIPDINPQIFEAAAKLDYNSLITVSIGYEGKSPDFHWVYFPQKDIPFHRLAFLSNYSSENAPPNCTSLVAEISCPPESELMEKTDHEILQDTINSLENLKLVKSDRIVATQIKKWKYAYIVYDHQRTTAISKIFDSLEDYGILQLGRFGSWNYWNMDYVIRNVEETLSNYLSNIK